MSDTESVAVPSSSEKEEKIAKDDPDKDGSEKSSDAETIPEEPVKPPELNKYWEAVKSHPGDFTGWTYLLQYVEQKNNIQYYREAFDEFFLHYPYCYGYWKKYGDTERKHGNCDDAYQVYERGVKAIPLCSDLWIHYITFQMQDLLKDEAREVKIRESFERAIKVCGLDFRSDKLWDYFIKFEMQHQDLTRVTDIYDKLLNIPTQQLSSHLTKFKELIRKNSPRKTLSVVEFLKHRTEYVSTKENGDIGKEKEDEDIPELEVPPDEEDNPPGVEVKLLKEENESKEEEEDEDAPPGTELAPPGEDEKEKEELSDEKELEAIKELAIKVREEIFKKTEEELKKRSKFEEQIRRPYFHAKPLEKGQLTLWKEYLDFEIKNGSKERTRILFERCLIACALYEEMWFKYGKYMESVDQEAASEVYRRACIIHLPKKPLLHLKWAAFEEHKGNIDAARKILSDVEQSIPGLVTLTLERIHLERRQKKYTKVTSMFKEQMKASTKPDHLTFYASKLACFLHKVVGDLESAKQVLKDAVEKNGIKEVLYMKMVDLEYQRNPIDEEQTFLVFQEILEKDLPLEIKVQFSKRKLEFTRDFCNDVNRFQTALEEHAKLMKYHEGSLKKRKRTDGGDDKEQKKSKVASDSRAEEPPAASHVNYNHQAGGGGGYPPGGGGYPHPTQYSQPYQQQQPQQQMDQTYNYQQQWSNYQNPYGYQQPQQWSGYGSGYYPS